MTDNNQNEWITDMLMGSTSTAPAELLEKVMADARCVAFGPVHHYIVGGVLLACWRNAEASPNRDSILAADLKKMAERSKAEQQRPPAWLTPSSATMLHCRRYEQDTIN